MTSQDQKEAIEHRDALLNIRAVLATGTGKNFLKYLFKNLDIGVLPEQGLEGNFLHDRLGFLRAGNSIFKLVAESNPEIAGELLAQIEKERYAELYADAQIGTN